MSWHFMVSLYIFLGGMTCFAMSWWICRRPTSVRLDGAAQWAQIKNRRLNPFGGTGPGISKARVERAVTIYEARVGSCDMT